MSCDDKADKASKLVIQRYYSHLDNTHTLPEYSATGPAREILDRFNPANLCEHVTAITLPAFFARAKMPEYVVWGSMEAGIPRMRRMLPSE